MQASWKDFWNSSLTSKVSWSALQVLAAQSCPTLCNSMDYSPPGSSVRGILQARVLEWVAISFSKSLHKSHCLCVLPVCTRKSHATAESSITIFVKHRLSSSGEREGPHLFLKRLWDVPLRLPSDYLVALKRMTWSVGSVTQRHINVCCFPQTSKVSLPKWHLAYSFNKPCCKPC